MKKIMSIFIISSLFFITLMKVEGSDITISFPLTSENRYQYEVKVVGNGTLYDGQQPVRNGIMDYSLAIGEEKTFAIKPDSGYEVKDIILNGEKLDSQVSEIKIKGVSSDSQLLIEFYEIKKESPVLPVNPIKPSIPLESQGNNKDSSIDSKKEDLALGDDHLNEKDDKKTSDDKQTEEKNIFLKFIDSVSQMISRVSNIVSNHPIIGIPCILLFIVLIGMIMKRIFKTKRKGEL